MDALGAGTATVTARVSGGGESDGVEQSFPILAHGRPILETRAGEGSADFNLALNGDYRPEPRDAEGHASAPPSRATSAKPSTA